jgi:hypothetical protein
MSIEEVNLRTGIRTYVGDPFDGTSAGQQEIEGDDEAPAASFPHSGLERPDEVLGNAEKKALFQARGLFIRRYQLQHAEKFLQLLTDPASVISDGNEEEFLPPITADSDGILMYMSLSKYQPSDPRIARLLRSFENGDRNVYQADDSR